MLFSFWFAMMSPWENSRWQLNRCPIGLQTGCVALNNSAGFAKLLKKSKNCSVRALLSPPVSLRCYFEETEWEEICRWCQGSPFSGVSSS